MKIKNYKIDHIFRYKQVRINSTEFEFGFEEASEIDITKPVIISYYSRSKFATEEEVRVAKKMGTDVASLEDYKKYISALTALTPAEFYKRWKDSSKEELEKHWKANFVSDIRFCMLAYKVSELIVTGKKFVLYGRGFKLIEPEEDAPHSK